MSALVGCFYVDVNEITSALECFNGCVCLTLVICFDVSGCAFDVNGVHFSADADTLNKIDRRYYCGIKSPFLLEGGESGLLAGPMLLDSFDYYDKWSENLETLYETDDEGSGKKNIGLAKHILELAQLRYNLLANEDKLGKMPEDLADVLTDMAIASPAICINRTYRKYLFGAGNYNTVLASQIAKIFINRMNTPESTAVVELCYGKSEEAHWRNLISYCKDGNMQAMFDEYAHLIANGLDKDGNAINRLHNVIADSLSIKTTLYGVDTLSSFKKRAVGGKVKAMNLRTHFAVAFTKGEGNSDKSTIVMKI